MISIAMPDRETSEVVAGQRSGGAHCAWRRVLRWAEAQFAMIDAGMTQPHEVFMPYAVIPGSDDKTMFQAWESSQKLLEAGK